MGVSALHKVTSSKSLQDALKHVNKRAQNKSKNIIGKDGFSLNSFKEHEAYNINKLSRQVRDKDFRFHPLTPHFISKANGKVRVICVPTLSDRILQRSILEYLCVGDRCKIKNSVSYGFIKGLSNPVQSAANKAKELRKNHRWVYKTDIQKFFDEIPREYLQQRIREVVRTKSLHDLLFRALSCEVHIDSKYKKDKLAKCGIKNGQGVRQGMPLSPLFANMVLSNFDEMSDSLGFKVVRYADDLIFLANSESECRAIHDFCVEELGKIDLTVPPITEQADSKTRIYSPDEDADFLGLSLAVSGESYVLNVSKQQMDRMKSELLMFNNLQYHISRGDNITTFGSKLDGKIAGYQNSYSHCDNKALLQKSLESWKKQAIEGLFSTGFGLDILALTSDQRHFLGLDHDAESK